MRSEFRPVMKIFRQRRHHDDDEIEAARAATDASIRTADEDVAIQKERLTEERESIIPMIQRLREQNHVADAIVHVIEVSRKK